MLIPILPMKTEDEHYILHCIALSKKSVASGDAPFGAIIVKDGEIIGASENNASQKISDHAEIMAMHQAHQHLGVSNLQGATLYSNCEPCPMCAFMAREYKLSRVVYAVPSPFMGGHNKWNIMEDQDRQHFPPYFGAVPEVIGGVLEEEGRAVFIDFGMWMFGQGAIEEWKDRIGNKD